MNGSFESLRRDTGLDEFEVDDPKAKWVGLLEKKWTSVIRLQKKACPAPHPRTFLHVIGLPARALELTWVDHGSGIP